MMKTRIIFTISFLLGFYHSSPAQQLKLEEALQRGVENYDKIKSKSSIASASRENTVFQKQQYLPEVTLSAQQSYGTINVQHGPMYGYGGLASAATSMPMAEQSWNAAFGSLYFANVNWNLFTFGRLKNQVLSGERKEAVATAELNQEIFQHQVRIAAAYLNLLASQRIKFVQQENFKRATVFFEITDVRAKSGLIAEVDAELARAEVSNSKSLILRTDDRELEYSRQLAVLLGETFRRYSIDTLYSTTIPLRNLITTGSDLKHHPVLLQQESKVQESRQMEASVKASQRPSLSAFGVLQGRGSGFDWNYAQDKTAFSRSYFDGVGIDRGNYLLGLSLTWNLTGFYRSSIKAREQRFLTQSLNHEFELMRKEIDAQGQMAAAQLQNAYDNYEEVKVQLTASKLAYNQHTALYENGLTNLIDFTQALYALNRAEVDYEIAQNNIWQALLLLASAKGDINIIISNK